jgi:predicted permease
MRTLMFDLRDALRSFRRDRGYAAVVIATLALTIGASTAVFSIVDGVLLKPLAYHQSEQLVALREIWRELSARVAHFEVNERHFEHWRQHSTLFSGLAQYRALPSNLTGVGEATQISVAHASGSLFEVLRQPAAVGRALTPQDEAASAAHVVITDGLWRRRFAADPGIVGRAVGLDGRPYTIVGVLDAGFRLPGDVRVTNVDAFIPLRVNVGWVGDHNNQAIGRLREGVTIEQARAELDVLQAQVSEMASKEAGEPVTLASAVIPLADYVVGRVRPGLLLLLGAIAAVMSIACANLANLSLTRTLGRLGDSAIRAALGASRGRLVRRALFEQLLLSLAGGTAGIAVAFGALGVFLRTAPIDLPRANEVTLDARVVLFAAGLSLIATMLVAVVPAWRLVGRDVQTVLRANAATVASTRSGLRSHAVLLAAQVGLAVTLLVVTTLLTVSFVRVMTVDRGFSSDGVLAVDISLPAARYVDERTRRTAYDRLLAAVRALPGVNSVTTTSLLPLRGGGQVNTVVPDGATGPRAEWPSANFRFVAPEFFSTLGIAIRRGRSFTESERDPNRPAPVLVSEPTAARLWPDADPIGKRFSRGLANEQNFEVVGVVADARTTTIDGIQPLTVYLPYWWRTRTFTSLLVKTSVDPSSLIAPVRRAVNAVDSEIAVGETRSLAALLDAALSGRRYQAQLFIAFGLIALFIAMLGVYAVTAHGVARRRREMNIRVALGAQTSQVVAMVLRQASLPVVAGVVAGAMGALAIGRLIASLLFEVQARDPLVLAGVVIVVAAVGVAASALAARRGLSIDPALALRDC